MSNVSILENFIENTYIDTTIKNKGPIDMIMNIFQTCMLKCEILDDFFYVKIMNDKHNVYNYVRTFYWKIPNENPYIEQLLDFINSFERSICVHFLYCTKSLNQSMIDFASSIKKINLLAFEQERFLNDSLNIDKLISHPTIQSINLEGYMESKYFEKFLSIKTLKSYNNFEGGCSPENLKILSKSNIRTLISEDFGLREYDDDLDNYIPVLEKNKNINCVYLTDQPHSIDLSYCLSKRKYTTSLHINVFDFVELLLLIRNNNLLYFQFDSEAFSKDEEKVFCDHLKQDNKSIIQIDTQDFEIKTFPKNILKHSEDRGKEKEIRQNVKLKNSLKKYIKKKFFC
jgi:hypothetical protein